MHQKPAQLLTVAVMLSLISAGCGDSTTGSVPLIGAPSSPPLRQVMEDEAGLLEPFAEQPLSLPFPERENPFLFPHDRVQPVVPAAEVSQVRVLGFVEVDQPRVLLKVSDRTRTLAVGDAAQGVEVLAIEPPLVRLRQGNLTWNASLFD
ncbi:hypothetical protein [Roseimaritima ulvae]|uniref:Uncharacterized protein n=1 Tax=Roseimaritima ulvae TaxID=980254 RepID=A0A5B9QZM5_9BACT|nr:hypothetical protein [Roseimaritima ulvae]QEG43542.1 hypothetical protein UC8_55930 [Roseimaritima ulvae]